MRRDVTLRECENELLFGNGQFTLRFDAKTGRWLGLESGQLTMAESGLPDCVLRLGGKSGSSLHDGLNVHWASQVFTGTYTLGANLRLLSHALRETQDAVELILRGEEGDFLLDRIYSLTDEGLLIRRFEAAYRGEQTEFVRGAVYYTPAFSGLTFAEYPGSAVPGENDLRRGVAPSVCENGYDLSHEGATLRGGVDVLVAHDETRVLSVYNLLIDRERSLIDLVAARGGFSVRQCAPVCARLNPGDTLTFGGEYLNLTRGDWKDEVSRIGRFYESIGHRVNPSTARETLRDLVIYETEIGVVRFREDKCHHVYDALADLTRDLPRLRDVGYNCVQLMPSFPFPGYTVYDLHRPEMQHSLGADLKPFVERAHALGMKVILDVLLHGVIDKEISRWNEKTYKSRRYYYPEWVKKCEYEVCPLRTEHPDWFIRQDDGEIFRVYTWSFDWANRGLQDWLCQALIHYVRDLDVDGFRFDAPNWVNAANFAENLPYRADKSYLLGVIEGFRRARAVVDPFKRDLIWLTEPEFISMRSALDVSYTYSTFGFWPRLFEGSLTAAQLQEFYAVRKRVNPIASLYVNWLDNHDSWNDGTNETGLYAYERFSPAFARSLLALALFQEGAYMAYAGNEKLDPDYYRRLVALRRRERIFREGECSFEAVHADSDALICIDWRSADEHLLAVVNMTGRDVTARLAGLAEGRYVDLVEGGAYQSGTALPVPANACLLLKEETLGRRLF